MYVYRGIVFKLLPFARFVDFLLLRLASKTEMKCNSYNARNAISNVQEVSRVLFFCKTLQICTLEHCCVDASPHFPWLFPLLLYFLPVILCPLFPNQITFFVLLKSFKYLIILFEFHYTRHFIR